MSKKKILFVVNHSAQLRAPFFLIKALQKHSLFNPVVYLNYTSRNLDKELQLCITEKINYLLDSVGRKHVEANSKNPATSTTKISIKEATDNKSTGQKIKSMILKIKIVILWRYYLNEIKEAKKILTDNAIKAVVLPEDASPEYGGFFVKACSQLNIPSVLLPFTLSNHQETLYTHGNTVINSIGERLFCLIFPKWKYCFKGKNYIARSLPVAIATVLSGLSPKNPWLLMGGNSSFFITENKLINDYYIKNGLTATKFIELGNVYEDVIFNQIQNFEKNRAALIEKYNLDANKSIMLCGLHPVYQDYNEKVDPFYGFETVGEMTDFWIQEMVNCDSFNVLIHCHPRTIPEKVNYIQQFGVKIVSGDIAEFLPFCDVYVSATSATIRMAIACGKPVLIYTMNFDFDDYINFPGVITTKKKNEFVDCLQKINNDKRYLQNLEKELKEFVKDKINIDGKAKERFINFFEKNIPD